MKLDWTLFAICAAGLAVGLIAEDSLSPATASELVALKDKSCIYSIVGGAHKVGRTIGDDVCTNCGPTGNCRAFAAVLINGQNCELRQAAATNCAQHTTCEAYYWHDFK